jgi:6-phosphogluconolactonase (cycloisomerase 2 family)
MKSGIKYFNCILIASVAFLGCKKELKQPTQDIVENSVSQSQKSSLNPREGFVYTMSNDAAGNSILGYLQSPNGSLSYNSTTASGGNGSGAGLGSQGSLVIDASHEWLYAVNAGSNSISSFKIGSDGALTLAHSIASNGTLPISVTVHGNLLYVVNSTTSNISGFAIGSGGSLSLIAGSNQPLSSANAGPAQISFTPGGQKLIVTEKNNNKITTYAVNGSGVASAPVSQSSAGQTPFGFDFSGSNIIVVSEASGGVHNASTVSAYSVQNITTLTGGPIGANQTSACWTIVTSDGRYAYVTSTSSNTISSFEVGSSGSLTLINAVEVTTGTTPIDLTVSGNGFYVYNINAGSHSISEYKKGGNETLKSIGEIKGLPAHAVGIVAY